MNSSGWPAVIGRLLGCFLLSAGSSAWSQVPKDARMSWLENEVIKVGVDLSRGGAIVYLGEIGGENLVNNFDLGRQVQLSYFSGPVPYGVEGKSPEPHWSHIGWNPIQAGDDFGHGSPVLAHENDGRMLHASCRPLQWPLDNVPGECVMDSWLELEGRVVKARARLTNARSDRTQWPARLQELPAVYANACLHRVVSYQGGRPFTGDRVLQAPAPGGKHPWSFWLGTEGWAALVDETDRGLGLVTPGRIFFTGGFAGRPGNNDTFGNSTGYLAGQGQEILDHNIVHEFRYELVVGGLDQIRAQAAKHRRGTPPEWVFDADRQGWFYQNMNDQGWPVEGGLKLKLDADDPQMISPHVFWEAEKAPRLVIEAAFKTSHKQAVIYWQKLGETAPGKEDHVILPIDGDGLWRRYEARLGDSGSYRGAMVRLRFDPVPRGEPGDWAEIKSIRLSADP
jgi:hypothetical protein